MSHSPAPFFYSPAVRDVSVSLHLEPLGDSSAVLVAPDGDAPHVGPRRRQIHMPQRLLRLREAARLFGDHARERVPRLVDVYLLDAGLACVALEVLGEGVRGERRARLPCPVVAR